jgi:hypothetical protein
VSNAETPGGLPPDAVVIRAGIMELAAMSDSMQDHFDKHHEPDGSCRDESRHRCYALSMTSAPGATAEELARLAEHPHLTIRVSSVTRVVDGAGWQIDPTPDSHKAHCDVFLDPIDGQTPMAGTFELLRLQQAFDPPIENPVKVGTP